MDLTQVQRFWLLLRVFQLKMSIFKDPSVVIFLNNQQINNNYANITYKTIVFHFAVNVPCLKKSPVLFLNCEKATNFNNF